MKHMLINDLSHQIRWFWLTLTLGVCFALPHPLLGLQFEWDYSLDESGYFSGGLGPSKRAALEAAASVWEELIVDEIEAIQPLSGRGYYDIYGLHPESGEVTRLERNPSIAANTLRIYVGSQSMSAQTLAKGGPGGYAYGGSWRNQRAQLVTNITRGESGITRTGSTRELGEKSDFAPWGGVITFNADFEDFHWNHRLKVPSDKIDFFSTCLHELGHVLGIGTSETWQQYVSGDFFQGPNALEAFARAGGQGDIPLTTDQSHWSYRVQSQDLAGENIMVPLMFASASDGLRNQVTQLDAMVLKDIGWEIAFGQMPAPQPVTLALTRELERIVLSVPSEPGRLYTLKSSNDFRQWIVSGEQSGDGQALEWRFPIREAHRFWRVEVR